MFGQDFSSPEKDSIATITPGSVSPRAGGKPWPVVTLEEIESSASPSLSSAKTKMPSKIQRTPQPTLSQSKLTGSGILQIQGLSTSSGIHPAALVSGAQSSAPPLPGNSLAPATAPAQTTEPPTSMDTSGPPAGSNLVTTDFLLRSLKENTDHIIQSFNLSLGLLSQKVDSNTSNITSNAAAIKTQSVSTDEVKADLGRLEARVRSLEGCQSAPDPVNKERKPLSGEYLRARRAARLWPVPGTSDEDLWGGVGEFLHCTMGISEDDVCQEDIEDVRRDAADAVSGIIREEVVVLFKDKQKRDLVMVNSARLAGRVDNEGRPTAGIRLEIPPELNDTYRMLSRFGTRIRAIHGEGTRRHIKFDDFLGSLFVNVKLPGNVSWTRVSPEMAQKDLALSMKEENAGIQRRLAAKLIPGSRQRLGLPMPEPIPSTSRLAPVAAPSRHGKRPRWSAPGRGAGGDK